MKAIYLRKFGLEAYDICLTINNGNSYKVIGVAHIYRGGKKHINIFDYNDANNQFIIDNVNKAVDDEILALRNSIGRVLAL